MFHIFFSPNPPPSNSYFATPWEVEILLSPYRPLKELQILLSPPDIFPKFPKENMKKYEGNMKKYVGNMTIRTLPIYGPWDLKKFRYHPFFVAGGGCSQFPGLGVPQRKDMEHVKKKIKIHIPKTSKAPPQFL